MNIKHRLRNGVAEFLFATGLTAPARRARGHFSIVTFHRVLPEAERQAYPYPGLVVTPQELDAFLAYLTAHFDCGPLAGQHERFLRNPRIERPLLALTFDDAQHDNHRYARPVLARHGVKASFFIPVAAVERRELLWHDRLGFAILALLKNGQKGHERLARSLADAGLPARGAILVEDAVQASKKLSLESRLGLIEALAKAADADEVPTFARLMTFGEIAELAAEGHEIGSHSMTHCMMPECDDKALNYELSESRRILQDRLAQPIESFCYPNGDTDARCALAVANAGYLRAVTTRWGLNSPIADQFQLRRCDMNAERVCGASGNFLPALLAFRMSGHYPGLR